jgi:hypothetical protein
MVLALSAMTLTWKDNHQARAASESFYNSALRHLQALSDNSVVQAMQISSLLAHYAHMCPERADNWTCIANAIRTVLKRAPPRMPRVTRSGANIPAPELVLGSLRHGRMFVYKSQASSVVSGGSNRRQAWCLPTLRAMSLLLMRNSLILD